MATATARVRPRRGAARWTIREVATLIAIAAVVVAAAAWPAVSKPASRGAVIVRVEAGDTLWSLASAYRLPGESTGQAVDEIKRLNRMRSSAIAEGMLLRVPARPSSYDVGLATR